MQWNVGVWFAWALIVVAGAAGQACDSEREYENPASGGAGESGSTSKGGKASGAGGASGGAVAAGGRAQSGGAVSTGGSDESDAGGGGESPGLDCGGVTCAEEASCVMSGDEPRCECPDGYTDPRGDGSVCQDIDECANENGGCDPLLECKNTPGGFECGGCPDGYTDDGSGGCEDIDECATANGDCDPLVVCTNTPGSRVCGNCPFGYEGDGEGGCSDIDECATDNGGCDPSATCTNTPGGFTCGDCPPGHTGGGATGCKDIDECATNNGGCDKLSKCTNTTGSFSCGACPSGYTGTGETGCVDVNECATNNGGCSANATCTNTPGGRTCACKSGFTGDGVTCSDVNECATNNGGCDSNATCSNTSGGRTCACKSGYSGDGESCVCAKAPTVPTLLAPARGAYTGSLHAPAARMTLRPTFVFSSSSSSCGAVTYELQADDSCTPGKLASCAFSSAELSVKSLAATSYTPPQDLRVSSSAPVGAFYAWRVRACDSTKVCSAWSSVGNLQVGRVREDVNGDGYGDLIILDEAAKDQPIVYYGAASPNFDVVSAKPKVAFSGDRIGAFIGDVDGDGYGDLGLMQLYTATNGYAPAVVFGGASLSARTPLVLSKSAAGSSLNLRLHPAGDFNGDGFADFLVDFMYFDPKTELQVFYGGSPPANQAALHIPCNFPGYQLNSNGIGDVNRDGYPDIALAEQGTVGSSWLGRIALFAGGASPSVTPAADISRSKGVVTQIYPGGDLNGDGYGDAVMVETGVGLVLYKGASTFSTSIWKTLANANTTSGLGGFDINGDGISDALLTGGTASIYLGVASTGPASATAFPTARGASTFGGVGFSDHDGDGLPDLVGATPDQPFWCSSAGTASPTCFNITNDSAAYAPNGYGFVR